LPRDIHIFVFLGSGIKVYRQLIFVRALKIVISDRGFMDLFSTDEISGSNYKQYINELAPDPSSELTACSFFSGAGGLDLGFHWAGINIIYANEMDPKAAETYEFNNKIKVDVRPIENIKVGEIPTADIFFGGFPCQPFSYSGQRLGLNDTRGTLFFDFVRLIEGAKPKLTIMENVAGLAKHDKGRTLKTILHILSEVGYEPRWAVLNAEHFGVPQTRRRTFIVSTRKDVDPINQFSFPQGFMAPIGAKDAIDDLIGDEMVKNNEPMQHRARVVERFSKIPPGGTWRDVPDEHKPRLRGDPSKISPKKMRLQSHQRLSPDRPCFTITANIQTHFIHYSENRNLTPREAARLQSFPDKYFFCGKRSFMSWDTELSQYQQIGNAVPPLLGRAVGRQAVRYFFENSNERNK
jgi:DNA (cytosine-5)-methyltransferase 1